MAQKRGGGASHISFEDMDREPIHYSPNADPAELFDTVWARTVVARSIDKLKIMLVNQGKEVYYRVFEKYYFNTQPEPASRKSLSQEFNISEVDVKNYLQYARSLVRQIIKNEVSEYVVDQHDIDEELNYLLSLKV